MDSLWNEDNPPYDGAKVFNSRPRACSLGEFLLRVILDPDATEGRRTLYSTYFLLGTPIDLFKNIFRLFSHPEKLRMTNVPSGKSCDATSLREGIVRFLHQWMDFDVYVFIDNPAIIELVMDNIKSGKKIPQTNALKVFLADLKDKMGSVDTSKMYPIRDVVSSQAHSSQQIYILSSTSKFTPEYIAQQLTLLEHYLAREIRLREIVESSILSNYKIQSCPTLGNIYRYLHHFKSMKHYFLLELIKDQSLKSACSAAKKAIQIAQICISYHNYSTPMQIIAALFAPSMIGPSREKVWESLKGGMFEILEQIAAILSSDDQSAQYKLLIRDTQPPAVPFLGTMISDVRQTHLFISTLNSFNLVNYRKLEQLYNDMKAIEILRKGEYDFQPDVDFQLRLIASFASLPNEMERLDSSNILNHTDDDGSSDEDQVSDMELEQTVPDKRKSERKDKKKQNKFKRSKLWKMAESFWSDAILLGVRCVDAKEFHLRPRDWQVLATSATRHYYDKHDIIIEENIPCSQSPIFILSEGNVSVERNSVFLRTLKSCNLIGHTAVLDPSGLQTALYTAASKCAIDVLDKSILVSVLESDADLSLRFFMDLYFHLMDQINRNHLNQSKDFDRSAFSRVRPKSSRSLTMSDFGSAATNQRVAQTVRPVKLKNAGHAAIDPKILRDQQFREMFSAVTDEVLLKEYRVQYIGRTLNVQGTLFVSQHHVCFYAKVFNHKTKLAIPFSSILRVEKKRDKLVIETMSSFKKRKLLFKFRDGEEDEACSIIENISNSYDIKFDPLDKARPFSVNAESILSSLESHHSSLEQWRGGNNNSKSISLTPSDWALLVRGSKRLSYRKNDVILTENQENFFVYQVVVGFCRLEKTQPDGTVLIFGSIGVGEVFGEMSFFHGKGSMGAVVAEAEEVEVLAMDGFYLSRLLQMRMELFGRFMNYLCTLMQRRLAARDRMESQEERRVVDIIVEPLHLNLIRQPVAPLVNDTIIHELCGPLECEKEEATNCYSTATPFCCATSVSTYPMREHPEKPGVLARDGTPICDQYLMRVYESRIIVAVADGCNWGEAPRDAAVAAKLVFVQYMERHQHEILDVQSAGSLILRAFAMANHEISRDKNSEIQQIGTTTLLGGIVVKLPESEEPIPEDADQPPEWGFVYGSVGDCKAFHWSAVTGKFSDITACNRTESLSASDCGGRLGPHLAGGLPDLRNFELGFFPCDEGDVIMIVSDGVHDNLDPEHLGYHPLDLGLEGEDWETVPDLEVAEAAKTEYRLEVLSKIVNSQIDSKSPILQEEREMMKEMGTHATEEHKAASGQTLPPPIVIARNLITYCKELCNASAQWMAENPTKRLPKDYRLYPGKMDHTTCCIFAVGKRSKKDVCKVNSA